MDLGWQELTIILVAIMFIFGAGKLPEIAKSLGQGVKAFREEAEAPATRDAAIATANDASIASSLTLGVGEMLPRPAFEARDAAGI
jgi:sec-independent protein translocase protein TatA